MKVMCLKTVEEYTYSLRKRIVHFEEGKIYRCIDSETTNVMFVIAEDGYKKVFKLNDYISTFKEL